MTALSDRIASRKDHTLLTIETTTEIDALSPGSVLLDRNGNPWQKLGLTQVRLWYMAGSRDGVDSEKLIDYAPLRHPTQPAPAGVIDREAANEAARNQLRAQCHDLTEMQVRHKGKMIAGAVLSVLHARTVAQVKAEALREAAATARAYSNGNFDTAWHVASILDEKATKLEREDGR